MYRLDYYNDGNIVFKYDLVGKIAIIHCEVKEWKLSVFKKAIREFANFRNEMDAIGVEQIITYTRNPKLVKAFGGRFKGSINMDGLDYEVYECL